MLLPLSRILRRQPLISMLISILSCCSAYSDDWIRGNSDNLEMRIRGEILDVDGQPAQAPSLFVSLKENDSSEAIDASVVGHRFELWLPVHRDDWHAVQIEAKSNDAQRRATVGLSRTALREVAMNGQVLTLHPSTRSVMVNVIHDNKPVANADFKVETSDGAVLHFQCDEAGSAEVKLLPSEKIYSFTAWTNEPLFGGFQFSREPVRDESAATQTIELFKCREQKFRVVDGQGNPCSDVAMFLQVATPHPHVNFLGSIEASRMVTNRDGEAVFRWFPNWEEVHCYVDLKSDQWVIDGESKWLNGDFIVQVKPRALRQKVFGKLECDKGSKAGYCVFWKSFQGEQERHSDFINAVTDQHGNFSADVLLGATYCVFINETRDVSDMIDLIPAPTDDAAAPTAILHLQEPAMLTISVTAGKTNRPIANQPVHVRQQHDYQWMVDGRQRSGSSARDRYVYTDELGKATVAVEPGKKVEVSIFNPDWRTSEELAIVRGQQHSVILHREIDEPRTILGVVLQDKDHSVPTDEITLIAGAVDGETKGYKKLALEANGVFRMQTKAVAVGVLATTKDQSMAGVVVAENPHRIMRLYLRPTEQLRGRLVDKQGTPITGRSVHATIRVRHEPKKPELNTYYWFDANRQTVKTDADGYYTFPGMPVDVEISLSAATGSTRDHGLGTVELQANEVQTVKTHTIDD
jgi:hypothetical protein